MNASLRSWEEAVSWLKEQPDQQALVRSCYYDDPLIESAQRFAESDEWKATQMLLPISRGHVLDIGAGRGISSYALAQDGWYVTALEPDPSLLVGAQSIRVLAEESHLLIDVIQDHAEEMPFKDGSFDLVYGRQVLHHARNLNSLCKEVARVLRPGGLFIATREHVISKPKDLELFLSMHPLHRLYGGENAYLLSQYDSAIAKSGLTILNRLGPLESAINYFPLTYDEWRNMVSAPLALRVGYSPAQAIMNPQGLLGRCLLNLTATLLSSLSDTPGRLYSFVAQKKEKGIKHT